MPRARAPWDPADPSGRAALCRRAIPPTRRRARGAQGTAAPGGTRPVRDAEPRLPAARPRAAPGARRRTACGRPGHGVPGYAAPGYGAPGGHRPGPPGHADAPGYRGPADDAPFGGGYAKVIRASDHPVRPAGRARPPGFGRPAEPAPPAGAPPGVYVYRDTGDQPDGPAATGQGPVANDAAYWYDLPGSAAGPGAPPQSGEEARGPFEPLVSSSDPPGTAGRSSRVPTPPSPLSRTPHTRTRRRETSGRATRPRSRRTTAHASSSRSRICTSPRRRSARRTSTSTSTSCWPSSASSSATTSASPARPGQRPESSRPARPVPRARQRPTHAPAGIPAPAVRRPRPRASASPPTSPAHGDPGRADAGHRGTRPW